MSAFFGSDGYGRFVIGHVDDGGATIWLRTNHDGAHRLRRQIDTVLQMPDVEAQLEKARARIAELERSNAALRGAIKRRRSAP